MTHYAGKMLKGRYRLTHKIGQGGMASVYLAEDTHLQNSLVAVKQNSRSHSMQDQQQFEREVGILIALGTNPSAPRNLPIIRDYDLDTDGRQNLQYLVMQYIEGEDLDSMVQRVGGLDEKVTLFWVGQVLDALEFLHHYTPPIIHRDIKPGNIRITSDGSTAFLVDFGIAGTINQMMGTEGFAPPEQYHGVTDARSDIYALGATLYMLFTAQPPPPAPKLEKGQAQLIPLDPTMFSLSPATSTAIQKAMQLDPAQRFQTIAEMRLALQPALPARRPSLSKNMHPRVQKPIPLDPPPPIHPRVTACWGAEANARTMRLVLAAQGRRLFTGGSAGQVRLWELSTWYTPGRYLGVIGQHQGWITSLAVSRDGRLIASGSRDNTIQVWDAQTAQPIGRPLREHQGEITALAFTPDGQSLLSASRDQTIRLWRLPAGGQPTVLAQSVLAYGLDVSPDEQWLAAACDDRRVRVWRIRGATAAGEEPLPSSVADHAGWVAAVAFSPNGALLAAGGTDQFVHLCATRDPQTQTVLAPQDWPRRYVVGQHPGAIYCLAFSPDGRFLVTGGADGTLQIWDIANNILIPGGGVRLAAEVLSVGFGPWPQSLALAAVTRNGEVALVQL